MLSRRERAFLRALGVPHGFSYVDPTWLPVEGCPEDEKCRD